MCGFQPAGRQWLQSGCLAGRPIEGSLRILRMGSLLQGLPRNSLECILGTSLGKRLLVPVGQCQTWIAPKWCIKSDSGHCQVRQSCRCSTLAAEFSGLSWMIKLFWTVTLCYRKASFVMFSRRNVQLHGRALQVKGSRSPLCCRAVKMQMTGLTSCCHKRTYGPPLQPGGLSQRRFPKRSFVRSGAARHELKKNGLDVPTSIYMITSSLAPLLMNPTSICLNRIVACQAHTSLRQQLWRSCRTMSPTFIRYGGCILLWWTCGGHGSTILSAPERSLISCGSFGIVRTPVE